ncbi:MAG TPA: hypothetical protein VFI46_02570 [Jiangellaceae bacterium]|nr:hypothetical protein [Jiangellaceae bacterium]
MDASKDTTNTAPSRGAPDDADGGVHMATTAVVRDRPFGPDAAAILATEHWSLIATRSLIWNEAMSRATVFLTVLSASIIALALLADATGFGPHTTTVALVLLPVVLLLGVATYVRLVQINTEEFQLVLAMNRLRRAYLVIAPGLEPYFTTGHHDDERSVVTTYMLDHPGVWRLWVHFLVNTPTVVATVDAALAATIVVLVTQAVDAPAVAVVSAAAVVFLAVWGTLFPLQRYTLRPLRKTPRFPTPPDVP